MENEKVEECDAGDEILRSRGVEKFCGDTGEDGFPHQSHVL